MKLGFVDRIMRTHEQAYMHIIQPTHGAKIMRT